MRQGLDTQAQKDAAQRWVEEKVNEAKRHLTNPPSRAGKTLGQYNQELLAIQANPFFTKVKNLFEHHGTDVTAREGEIDQLKAASINALVTGKKPPGIMDILGGAFQNFDIMNPITSLKNILVGAVKSIVMLIGGDMAAPWMESTKSRFMSRTPMTVKEAEQNLRFKNGAQALAGTLGVPEAGFVDKVADQLGAMAKQAQPQPQLAPGISQLKQAVTAYAEVRFSDPAKRVEFVERYTRMALAANLPLPLQEKRAREIEAKTAAIRTKINAAKTEAKDIAEANETDPRWASVENDVQDVLKDMVQVDASLGDDIRSQGGAAALQLPVIDVADGEKLTNPVTPAAILAQAKGR